MGVLTWDKHKKHVINLRVLWVFTSSSLKMRGSNKVISEAPLNCNVTLVF